VIVRSGLVTPSTVAVTPNTTDDATGAKDPFNCDGARNTRVAPVPINATDGPLI